MSDLTTNEPLPGPDAFREVFDTLTGEINPDLISYTEEDTGTVWQAPRGHRFFDLYERWVAAGNVAQPPQDKTAV